MKSTNDWLQEFTGISVTDGTETGTDLAQQVAGLEIEARLKQTILAEVRNELAKVKVDFQKAMATELANNKSFLKLKKEQLLKVEGSQIDEMDFTEIEFYDLKLSSEASQSINHGTTAIANCNERLKAETVERNGKQELLFTAKEIADEFWTPLVRERILPETFVADMYSKTQRMLDETNKLYELAIAKKEKEGKLTPELSLIREGVDLVGDLGSVASDLVASFGGDTAGAQLAVELLTLSSDVIKGGGQIYDKAKEKEFADASSLVLGNIEIITQFALGQAGFPSEVIDSVSNGFDSGKAAIAAGKAFAKGADGMSDGLNSIADVLNGALAIAVASVSDPAMKESLEKAMAIAPNALKSVAIGKNLVGSLEQGDAGGVVDCLTQGAQIALKSVQDVRKIQGTSNGDELDQQTGSISTDIDLAGTGLKLVIENAILVKRGDYIKALNGVIDGIGAGLSSVLVQAGVSEDEANQIATIYSSAVSAKDVLAALCENPPKVADAVTALGEGIESSFSAIDSKNVALQQAGAGMKNGFLAIASGIQIKEFYDNGEYDKGIRTFTKTLQVQVKGVFKIKDMTIDGDPDEEPLQCDLVDAIGTIGKAVSGTAKEIGKGLGKAKNDLIAKTVLEEEADGDDEFDIEALKIENLIAKIERDRALWELAVKLVEGGMGFAAKFVPALGAVGDAARLVANMVAAGQRLNQFCRWRDNQLDFLAAQDELESSARNFVKNQATQATYYTVKCLFGAAKIIGQLLELGGVTSTAGAGLEAVGKAGDKLTDIIYKFHKKSELEAAWKLTQKSFKNPANRRLGLQVRKLNPSLAKYTIAWGAVVKKNPLARNALGACHLTEATLSDKDLNADKVVDYLERFYNDDDQLYRKLGDRADWIPDDMSLDPVWWMNFKKLAVENAKLSNPDTGSIDGLLTAVKGTLQELKKAEVDRRVMALQSLVKAFAAYKPKTEDPALLDPIKYVVQSLQKEAAVDLEEATRRAAVLGAQMEAILKSKEQTMAEVDKKIKAALKAGDLDALMEAKDVAQASIKALASLKGVTEAGDVDASIETIEKAIKELDDAIDDQEAEQLAEEERAEVDAEFDEDEDEDED